LDVRNIILIVFRWSQIAEVSSSKIGKIRGKNAAKRGFHATFTLIDPAILYHIDCKDKITVRLLKPYVIPSK